jgi:hypothetical protein
MTVSSGTLRQLPHCKKDYSRLDANDRAVTGRSAVHQLWGRIPTADHMGCDALGSPADMLSMKC